MVGFLFSLLPYFLSGITVKQKTKKQQLYTQYVSDLLLFVYGNDVFYSYVFCLVDQCSFIH